MDADVLTCSPRRAARLRTRLHHALVALLAAAGAGALVAAEADSWRSIVPALSATAAAVPEKVVPVVPIPVPETTFFPRAGMRLVGVDIAPGAYRVTGSIDCYWVRLSGVSGRAADVVSGQEFSGGATVQVLPSDVAVFTSGCAGARRVAQAAARDRSSSARLRRAHADSRHVP